MGKIILLAETGSDIPAETARQHGIYIVPMHVSFGEETRDDGTFPAEEVVDYYKRTGKLPKTSGCVPEDFEKIYNQIHNENPESQILYLAYSSVTTCSYQSGQIAAQNRDYITSIDTKHVSVGQYVVVTTMAKLLKEHPEWKNRSVSACALCRIHWSFCVPAGGSAMRRLFAAHSLRFIRELRFLTDICRQQKNIGEIWSSWRRSL